MSQKTSDTYHPVTRWLHAGLVLGVLFQLFCAAMMAHPDHNDGGHGGSLALQQEAVAADIHHATHEDDAAGELFMAAHRTGGTLVAWVVLANLLWAIIARGNPRKRQIAVLFSARHWHEAWSVARNLASMLVGKGTFPEPGNSLSLIVEMFGLLAMAAMALTGSMVWSMWGGPDSTVSEQAELWMGIHGGIAVLLLMYLIGHVSMALLHLRAGDPVFTRILPVSSNQKLKN